MLPLHSKGKKGMNGRSVGRPSKLETVSRSTWILILFMTMVNLFLFAYTAGLGKLSLLSSGEADTRSEFSSKSRGSHGSHGHGSQSSGKKSSHHSYFSADHFKRRKDLEVDPHKDMIRSNVVVATFATEAYLYHVKTLVGSVQYWQQDFQLSVYYKSVSSKNLRTKLESLESLRAISLEEAVHDILEMRDEGKGKCSSLLNTLGSTLDNIEKILDQETGIFQPIVTLHSFCTSEDSLGTIYIEPWMFFNGWIDIAVRSLQYERFLVPCTHSFDSRNACLRGIQGYGSLETVEELLLPQVGCTAVGSCRFLDKVNQGTGRASVQIGSDFAEGGGSWWTQKAPQYLTSQTDVCLNSTSLMVASHHKVWDLGEDGEEATTCLIGESSKTYQCHLRYNPIVDYTHFASSKKAKRGRKGGPSVVLGFVIHTPVATMTNNAADMAVLESALTTLRTDLRTSQNGYDTSVYLAFESSGTEEVDAEVAKQIRYQMKLSLEVSALEIFSIGNTDSISTASNFLFQRAMSDNHDYFMAFGDAAKLVKSPSGLGEESWLGLLISTFSSPILPNFGVVAPFDHSNPKGMTCPLVHRTHYDIFGELYPSHLTFYESQLWISLVYGYQYTYLMTDVEMNTEKQKAPPCMNDYLLHETVEFGKKEIVKWAQKTGGTALDYIASFLSVQEL